MKYFLISLHPLRFASVQIEGLLHMRFRVQLGSSIGVAASW
jgi:hypothetical protein